MEKVTRVCSDVKPVGEPDQYGNHAFNILFNDSTSGFFKCKEQNLFQVGEPATFYIGKVMSAKGKEYTKIERVEKHEFEEKKSQPPSTGEPGVEKSKTQYEQINRSVSIKSACQLFQGQKIDREYVLETAEMFFDYINFGIKDPPQEGEAALPVQPITHDELPF